jgi:hypothetical protein
MGEFSILSRPPAAMKIQANGLLSPLRAVIPLFNLTLDNYMLAGRG